MIQITEEELKAKVQEAVKQAYMDGFTTALDLITETVSNTKTGFVKNMQEMTEPFGNVIFETKIKNKGGN